MTAVKKRKTRDSSDRSEKKKMTQVLPLDWRRAAGWAAVAAPLMMWSDFLTMATSRHGYNLLTRPFSDLATRGTPHADLFALGFFFVPGLLTAVLGFGLYARCRFWRNRPLRGPGAGPVSPRSTAGRPVTRWAVGGTLALEIRNEVAKMKVGRFCNTEVITAEVTDTLFEAAQKMARNHVGALAVLDEGALVGVISEADLVAAVAEEASLDSTSVDEYMTEGAITVGPGDEGRIAARRMVEHGIGHLPVVDGESTIGMVSKGDLLAVGAVAARRD